MSELEKIGALYIRVSTDKQEELSPDAQKRLLLDYAKKNNILVDAQYIYQENGISGRSADKRPEFQKMIATAKTKPKPFDVILVWKYSRFARNQDESVFYKSILRKKCGIDVVSITEPIAEGMYGRLIEMIIEWNDEFYSYNLSQEVKRGMDEKALRGGYQISPPLGYDAVGKGKPFTINEEEYRVYQLICDKFDLEGLTPYKISKYCNTLGITTKYGAKFCSRTIIRTLRNPFYVGEVNWNGHCFEGTHEIRADRERFDERQKKLDAICYTKGRHDPAAVSHWLSGIVKCPTCGAFLCLSGSKDRRIFQCWRYQKSYHTGSVGISERRLTAAVLANFEKILNDGDFQYETVPARHDSIDTHSRILADLEKLAKREERVKLAYQNEVDTLEEYKENKQRIAEERTRLLALLEQKEEPEQLPKHEALKRIESVYEAIKNPDVDNETKGTLLRTVLDCIVYDKKNNVLEFHFVLEK